MLVFYIHVLLTFFSTYIVNSNKKWIRKTYFEENLISCNKRNIMIASCMFKT